MKKALINIDKCKKCIDCIVEIKCPMHALFRESKDQNFWIDFFKCSGCMKCKINCPNKAVEMISHPCNGKPQIGW